LLLDDLPLLAEQIHPRGFHSLISSNCRAALPGGLIPDRNLLRSYDLVLYLSEIIYLNSDCRW
jgi:hypothetical protein